VVIFEEQAVGRVLKNKNGVLEIIRKRLLTPHRASPARGRGIILSINCF